jgi:hypothetical protein
MLAALGSKSLYLPDLADRVELQRWRTTVEAMFTEISL